MKNFFITGLPRSRTAWLSVFMSQGNSFCYHEAMRGCKTKQEYYDKLALEGYDYVGDSNSALTYTDYQEKYPEAPLVIIHRPTVEIYESLRLLGIRIELRTLAEYSLELRGLKGLHVEFDDIDNSLNSIFYHCTEGGKPVNTFTEFNIQLKSIDLSNIDIGIWRSQCQRG